MTALWQALRSALQRPAFALTAVLTIALGIGANTAVYAVVHAVLLSPLPFRQPQELVQVWETHPELHNLQVSAPDYLDWKASVKSLHLAAYTFEAMDKTSLLGQGVPIPIQATNASAELFPLLGIKPLLGRIYGPDDQKQPLVLLSEHLWRYKFSADVHVVGRAIRLGTASFTVAGILPDRNAFPQWADVWMPLSLIDPNLSGTRKFHPLEVVGRLKPGASLLQAELDLERVARNLAVANPATNGKIGAHVVSLDDSFVGAVRPALVLAWAAVCLVLLIACANLAHLMMARSLNRRAEMALRVALGASRLDILRLLATETILLSAAGGLLGIVAASFVLPVLERLASGQLPRLEGVAMNGPVLLFGGVACFLVALLFAAPAWLQALRSDLIHETTGSSRGHTAKRSWATSLLLASEVAFSGAVLVTALLLLRSSSLALQTSPGFDAHNRLVVHTPLVDGDWQKSYELFQSRVAPALKTLPSVSDVAAVNSVPMSLGATEHTRFATRFGIVGRDFEPGHFPTAQIRWSTPNYFQVLGIRLLNGRWLRETDNNQPVYLINETLARRFFPHSNPVGQKLLLGVVTPNPQANEIAGVVADVHEFGLTADPEPTMYSIAVSPEMDVVVRAASANAPIEKPLAAMLRRVNPQAATGPVKPLADYVAASVAKQRFILTLIASFALIALSLCAVGIYGVFSYSVSRRLREFGVRVAIGARRRDVVRQVVGECLFVTIPGTLAGIALSLASARLMRSLLYRVAPTDPLSSGAAVCLIGVLCVACVLLPAVRAARVDPASMLREQ
jgi:predicted permease